MPCWYYEKRDLKITPSIKDGLTLEVEQRYRREGARFILNCGLKMGLGHNTVATGVVYFHRFYIFHSFKTFPRYVTACCCLFLAGKVEETPKKCRDIIRNAKNLLSDDHFYSFGQDPKEEVMTLERILLQTIKFDLQVEHPYGFLLKYAKSLKGDQPKLQRVAQMAWNFVNDSLSTTLCLQWEPEIIAVAMIHLASKLTKFVAVDWIGKQQNQQRWWDMFVSDVTTDILEDICHQVLDLYQKSQSNIESSPPQQPPSRSASPNAHLSHGKNSIGAKTQDAKIENQVTENKSLSTLANINESAHFNMYSSNYSALFQHGSISNQYTNAIQPLQTSSVQNVSNIYNVAAQFQSAQSSNSVHLHPPSFNGPPPMPSTAGVFRPQSHQATNHINQPPPPPPQQGAYYPPTYNRRYPST